MSDQDAFERILASLHDATLNAAQWPVPSALIDEACGIQGNALLPHLRQFARVQQTLAKAEALGASVTGLLDTHRIGVIHLDRHGRIVEANDRARAILRHGDGLSDRGGLLYARVPADALPTSSAPPCVHAVAVRGAGQTRGCPAGGLWGSTRRCAGADCRAGAGVPYRFRPSGRDSGPHAGGEPNSGLVGRRQDRA